MRAARAQSRERKLVASPKTTIGGHDLFAELLFSPRMAFIWDETRKAVTWVNAAARSKFGLGPAELQEALPHSLTRCFAKCFEGKKARVCSAAKVKLAGFPALDCSLDALELAGGNRGLIVSEIAARKEAPGIVHTPAPRKKPAVKLSGKQRPASKKQAQKLPAKAGELTLEELRAFKAIGGMVRELARNKPSSAQPSPARIAARSRSADGRPSAQAGAAPVFSAYDLVLFLGQDFRVVAAEGRAQRLGWRKPGLLAKHAAQLLLPGEQAIFDRMTKKLCVTSAQFCRETLVVLGEGGNSVPCRAVLCRWPEGKGHYFLGLISLVMPARLQRMKPRPLSGPGITQLAA